MDETDPPGGGLQPGLHVVATPIGNLGDMTARAIETLRAADLVLCEDTRVTGRLLQAYGVKTPMRPYHDHNAAEARPDVLARLSAGAAVALVSDAGTPLVSDPGYKLVRAARDAGHPVFAVPGPSAAIAALSIAGAPTDRFLFAGFPPAKSGARAKFYAELAAVPATLVVYETGPRLGASLADLAAAAPGRRVAVARELTKKFEEVVEGTAEDLAPRYAAGPAPKGEIVLVVHPPEAEAASADDLDAALAEALETLSVKDAAAAVSEALSLPKKTVYARALALKQGR